MLYLWILCNVTTGLHRLTCREYWSVYFIDWVWLQWISLWRQSALQEWYGSLAFCRHIINLLYFRITCLQPWHIRQVVTRVQMPCWQCWHRRCHSNAYRQLVLTETGCYAALHMILPLRGACFGNQSAISLYVRDRVEILTPCGPVIVEKLFKKFPSVCIIKSLFKVLTVADHRSASVARLTQCNVFNICLMLSS